MPDATGRLLARPIAFAVFSFFLLLSAPVHLSAESGAPRARPPQKHHRPRAADPSQPSDTPRRGVTLLVFEPADGVLWYESEPGRLVPATYELLGLEWILDELGEFEFQPTDLVADLDRDGLVTAGEFTEFKELLAFERVITSTAAPHGPSPPKPSNTPRADDGSSDSPDDRVCVAVGIDCLCGSFGVCDPQGGGVPDGCETDCSRPCRNACCPGARYCCTDPDPCCGVSCGECRRCIRGSCRLLNPCCWVKCSPCESCFNGVCVPDYDCCDVDCPDCQACDHGQCVVYDLCCGVDCPHCETCRDGVCEKIHPCCGKKCDPCFSCENGQCVLNDPCCLMDCPDCQSCEDGACVQDSLCCGVTCGACERCVEGECVGRCSPGQTCCSGKCCQKCCDGNCCGVSDTCCNGDCCAGECCDAGDEPVCCHTTCEECLINGALSGGTITVDPPVVCIGGTITFTAGGVVDDGGIQRVSCYAKEAIDPVEPTYTWSCTLPPLPPSTAHRVLTGTGPVATLAADAPGTYQCYFKAKVERDCAPGEHYVGSASASANGCTVTLSSATGRPCEVIPLTLTGICPPECTVMTYALSPEYPSGYDLVEPWFDVTSPDPKGFCTGQPDTQTISVLIHADAPPGPVPIRATAQLLNGNTCQATATLTVYRDPYDNVLVEYNTFIAPELVFLDPAPDPPINKFHEGDDRWFGQHPTSRTRQIIGVTLDPTQADFTLVGQFGTSRSYSDFPLGSDALACEFCPVDFADYDDWCLAPFPTPECQATAAPGISGDVLQATYTRTSGTTALVHLQVVGSNPCVVGAPAIDVDLHLQFRQECNGTVLKPLEFRRFSGQHDGFPWHELIMNGIPVYQHDPCCTHEDSSSLFGGGEWNYTQSLGDACHPPLTGIPVAQWQPVPGLGH